MLRPSLQLVMVNATLRCSSVRLIHHISTRLYYWICKTQKKLANIRSPFDAHTQSPPGSRWGSARTDPIIGSRYRTRHVPTFPSPVATWRPRCPFASVKIKSWLRPCMCFFCCLMSMIMTIMLRGPSYVYPETPILTLTLSRHFQRSWNETERQWWPCLPPLTSFEHQHTAHP